MRTDHSMKQPNRMNRYQLRVTFDIEVEAENEDDAINEAKNSNDRDLYDYPDVEIVSVDENIENRCFMCNRMGTDGSNDKMCTECLFKWKQSYDEHHE